MLIYQALAYTIHEKRKKKSNKNTINLKYQLQHGMKNLNYLMVLILCQIGKVLLNMS